MAIKSRSKPFYFFFVDANHKYKMAELRLIGNATLPYVRLSVLSRVTGISEAEWMRFIMDPRECSVAMVRSQEGLYIEMSVMQGIISRKCSSRVLRKWKNWMSFHSTHRKLTEPEKRRVASQQQWKCATCDGLLTDVYEVDHIEQQCIRNNQRRRNLQALCPKCHREKTVQDRIFGDGLFDAYMYDIPTCKRDGSGVRVSSYFDRKDDFDVERGYEK